MLKPEISELLDDKETVSFGIRLPKKLLDRILAAYKKVTAGAVRGNPKGPALAYFAARGLLDYEAEVAPSAGDIAEGQEGDIRRDPRQRPAGPGRRAR